MWETEGSVFGGGAAADPNAMVPNDSKGVMAGSGDQSEEAMKKRYLLQKNLISKEPDLRQALADQFANLTKMYAALKVVKERVSNQTQLINADASAGGLLATSRSLMVEIPLTQRSMSKVMDQLVQSMVKDSKAINETLGETEDDYRQAMSATSETVSAVLAKQDKTFAGLAYAQEGAMAATATQLKTAASAELRETDTEAKAALMKLNQVGNLTREQTVRMQVALRDAEDMPAQVEALQKKRLAEAKTKIDTLLVNAESKAGNRLAAVSDKSLTLVENNAMIIARNFQSELSKMQKSITKSLTNVSSEVARTTGQIEKEVISESAKAESAIGKIESDSIKEISKISQASSLGLSDSMKVVQDSQSVLDKLSTMLMDTKQNVTANLGKTRAAIPLQIQAALQKVTGVQQGINGDVVNEMLSENGGVAYIGQVADAQSAQIGAVVDSKLASSKKELSARSLENQQSIDSLNGVLETGTQKVATNTALVFGQQNAKLEAISSMTTDSVADVSDLIKDSSESTKAGMADMVSGLMAMNSGAMTEVLSKVRDLGGAGSDGLKSLITSIIGPNNELTDSQFAELGALLATLADMQAKMGQEQDAMMAGLKSGHAERAKELDTFGYDLRNVQAANLAKVDQIGAKADNGLAIMQSDLKSQSLAESEAARQVASDGLHKIDGLFSNLDTNFRSIQKGVSGTLTGVSTNVDIASKEFNQLSVDNAQRMAGVNSASMSLIRSSEKQQVSDFKTTKETIEGMKTDFVQQYQQDAAARAEAIMANVTTQLNQTAIQKSSVKSLVGELDTNLARISNDLAVGAKFSDSSNARLSSQVADISAKALAVKETVTNALQKTIEDFQKQLKDKQTYLNVTSVDLNKQLGTIKQMVADSQRTLQNNLQLYQSRMDGVIAEIRSYMNLSANADELAIQHGIATQLAGVNQTAVQLALVRSATEGRLAESQAQRASQKQAHTQILNGLIDGALSVEESVSNSQLANTDALIRVGLTVDENTNKLRTQISTQAAGIQAAMRQGRKDANELIKKAEVDQATTLAAISVKSQDVQSQSRKKYLEGLYKMDSLTDDVSLVSKQLSGLLSNTNATVANISRAAMDHLRLGKATMEELNSAQNSKIASIGDVMNAFASIVQSYLNETETSMGAVMGELDEIDSVSKRKLAQIKLRTRDEVGWIANNVNNTQDSFETNLQQVKSVREGLMAALRANGKRLGNVNKKQDEDVQEIQEGISRLESSIRAEGQNQINKVRNWIVSRSPTIAKKALKNTGSLLQRAARRRRRLQLNRLRFQ